MMTATAPPERLWTLDDIAAFVQVTKRTVRNWRAEDPFFPEPLPLPGRVLRWHPDQIESWAVGQPTDNYEPVKLRRRKRGADHV